MNEKTLRATVPISFKEDLCGSPSGGEIVLELPLAQGLHTIYSKPFLIREYCGRTNVTVKAALKAECYPEEEVIKLFPEDPANAAKLLFFDGQDILDSISAVDTENELAQTAGLIQKAVEAAAQAEGYIVIRAVPITDEMRENDFNLLYKNGCFAGIADPEKEYGDDCRLVPFTSTFQGQATFTNTTEFANVIGSTDDGKDGGKLWIDLWEKKRNKTKHPTVFDRNITAACASYNAFYNPGSGVLAPGETCNGTLIGGHVLKGRTARKIKASEKDKRDFIFIIPICRRHNQKNQYFMKPNQDYEAIAITGYSGLLE